MFEPLHDNGIEAGLITEFGRINCNSIAKGMSLEFIPENVDENIRRLYALDEFVRHDANGNVDTCEMLVVRGWVMEKTFGTNDAVRMESNHVIRNVLRQHPRGLALIRDKEIVERVYAFYSKEGVKVVEVRVKIPHRFLARIVGGVVWKRPRKLSALLWGCCRMVSIAIGRANLNGAAVLKGNLLFQRFARHPPFWGLRRD
jgi:hypothetical protein